jgi:hydrogenase maturation protease
MDQLNLSEKVLILGFGNTDRQDDGVAWHVIEQLAARLGRPLTTSPDDGLEPGGANPDLAYYLQLTPEMAEIIAAYDRVCFIDAHNGSAPLEINLDVVQPEMNTSPFTHHLTPCALLAIAETLYSRVAPSILVSVRAYEFGFSRQLSPKTVILVDPAVEVIWKWLLNQPE